MSNVLEVEHLVKKYKLKDGEKIAIDDVSFNVKEGEVFGLLGPNGAGKTTTIKTLTTLLLPTSGKVNVLGFDVVKESKKIRKHINFVYGGEKGVYGRLTAVEYMYYFCTLYKIPKNEQQELVFKLLQLVGLQETAINQPIHTFSKGMVQRLHIARCLINSPKIIFLDEPTIGLDPVGAKLLRNIVKELSQKGITIILTTHYMHEADELCDRIAFMKQGKISLIGTSDYIKESCNHLRLYEAVMSVVGDIEQIKAISPLEKVEIEKIKEPFYTVRFETPADLGVDDISRLLSQQGEVLKLQKREISLEDAYIFHMGD